MAGQVGAGMRSWALGLALRRASGRPASPSPPLDLPSALPAAGGFLAVVLSFFSFFALVLARLR